MGFSVKLATEALRQTKNKNIEDAVEKAFQI
jgi:hypothetical protein